MYSSAYVAWRSCPTWRAPIRATQRTKESMELMSWSPAAPSPGLVNLNLVWQQLTAAVHVAQDLVPQLGHLLPEQVRRGRQVGVLVPQRLHLVLQPGDPLQFAPPALGGRDPVPEPLPLGFPVVLWVHVDGGERRTLPEALDVGDRLRLLLQRRDPRQLRRCPQVKCRRGREVDRVRGVVDGGSQRPGAVAVEVGVHRQVRLEGDRDQVGSQVQAAALALPVSAQLVLLVQILQRLHEALGELLLVRHRLRVEELGAGGRRGHHPVGLDDQPLQLRGGQLQEPQVRGAEDALGVAEMRLEVRVLRQSQVHVLLHHCLRVMRMRMRWFSQRSPAHNKRQTPPVKLRYY